MAQKRMYSKDVIDTERFYSLPAKSQLFYFHLGMHADCRGFVEPKKISRLTGIKMNAIDALIERNFIIFFNSELVLISDWNVNNSIRESHEAPTQYTNEYNMLLLSDNGRYQLQPNYSSSPVELPHSIDKVSIGSNAVVTTEEITDKDIEVLSQKLGITPEGILSYYKKIKDYEESTGKKYKNYPKTIEIWVGRLKEKGGIQL